MILAKRCFSRNKSRCCTKEKSCKAAPIGICCCGPADPFVTAFINAQRTVPEAAEVA